MSNGQDAYELETPAPVDSIVCHHCGAQQTGLAIVCWLCKESLSTPLATEEPEFATHVREPEPFSYSLATLFLLMTLAAVCMGLLVSLQGLGVMACIVMVPVFVRTLRVVRHRERLGKEVSPVEKVSLFLGSFVVSSVLVIVVCVAAFCSFCGVCLTVVALGDPDALPVTLGMCAIGLGAIVVAVRIFKWNRQRFRREIGGQ